MIRAATTCHALITCFLVSASCAEDVVFLNEVESRIRRISNSDEGLGDPVELERLQNAMRDGRDWDRALVRLIEPSKYEEPVAETAIYALQLHGSFEKPEVEDALNSYFISRVKAARAYPRSDELFVPVVRAGIRGLSSQFATHGGPNLLRNVLDFAVSIEERSDPLLDESLWAAITDVLLVRGDSRHLEGMRKLLAIAKNEATKGKLERTIAKVASEAQTIQPKETPKPLIPRTPTPSAPVPDNTPLPAASVPKVAETPATTVEHRTLVWPWAFFGIVALLMVVALALKRRA